MKADHHQLPHLILLRHGRNPSVHLFRHGFIGLQDGTVRYGSYRFLFCLTLTVVPTTATSKARPLRTRRKNWFISPKSSLMLTQYYEYYGLSMLLSQCNTHKSPLDPYSIFLYYTLNDSSFPHNKIIFFILNYYNKVIQ